MDFFRKNKRFYGFTLIEALVVIGVIAALAAIVLVAVDPALRLAQSRNARRWADVRSLTEATLQYTVDHAGNYPSGINETLRMIGTATSGCAVACGQQIALGEVTPSPGGSSLAEGLMRRAAEGIVGGPAEAQASVSPTITSFTVQPVKVTPGDVMTATVEVEDSTPVSSVRVDFGGLATVSLVLTAGDGLKGTWQGSWTVKNTRTRDYVATATVTDGLGATATATAPWTDPLTGWIEPTGATSPTGNWSSLANAYDGNLTTYASDNTAAAGWSGYIDFSLTNLIYSNRVRVNTDFLDAHIQGVQVDVSSDGVTWTNVLDGIDGVNGVDQAHWNDKWAEVTFPGQNVTQARFRYNYRVSGYVYWMYEFQFYQTVPVVTPPTCQTQPANLVQDVAATLHATLIDDGGEPCDYDFQYGLTPAYGTDTGWVSGAAAGVSIDQFVNGLTPSTQYYFHALARNSAGQTDCSPLTFTTKPPATGWVSPSGYSDPDGKWENQLLATDQDTVTYARSYHNINDPQWSSFIYYTHDPIIADKVRLYARGLAQVDLVYLDALVDGSWVHVYDGAFPDQQWVEYGFAQGNLSQVRAQFHATVGNQGFFWQLNEIEFQKSSEGTSDACLDLTSLAPQYIASIPVDPLLGTPAKTLYAIQKTTNGRILTYACNPELGATIKNSR